jgi:hypothetical protein
VFPYGDSLARDGLGETPQRCGGLCMNSMQFGPGGLIEVI